MVCHLLFWRRAEAGQLRRPGYRLPGSPWTEIVTLVFLASVLVLMWADGGAGRTTVLSLPVIGAALVAGWFLVRRRVGAVRESAAHERHEREITQHNNTQHNNTRHNSTDSTES
jgi:L-asparagine permease